MNRPDPEIPSATARISDSVGELIALLRLNPDSKQGWFTLFKVFFQQDNITPALELAFECMPRVANLEEVFLPVCNALHFGGMHDACTVLCEKILARQPDALLTQTRLLLTKQLYGIDQADAWGEFHRWNRQFVFPIKSVSRRAHTAPEPDRPLRIGFVSNDFGGKHTFNTHIATWFSDPDARRDTYVFYSNCAPDVPIHKFFRDAADEFVDVGTLSDEELAARIRSDRIDIVVDMISHHDVNRLLAYARMPAPIIVAWIAVAMPICGDAVDYTLADEILIPRESLDNYPEKMAYFPETVVSWHPPGNAPEIAPPPSLRNGFVTFGILTRMIKFTPQTLDLWAAVLHRVPNSRFMTKYFEMAGTNAERILSLLEQRGISRDRIEIRPGTSQQEHLATYGEIDIVLDCYPQHGGMSSLEAVWMGVPVVTLCHPTKPSGRVGRYILQNVGLTALVSDTPEQYVQIAAALAHGPDTLASLRQHLRQRMANSPICDTAAFRRRASAAFRHMWTRYCAGLPPETFTVADD